jgi:hypothetical protein
MNILVKRNLVKNLSSAFINGLITLILLIIAPLGLVGVIFNTLAVTVSTFIVTMSFDFIALWLLNSPKQSYFDRPLEKESINPIIRKNNPNLTRSNEE